MIARPTNIIVRVLPNYLQESECNERVVERIGHLHLSLTIKTTDFRGLPVLDFTKLKSILDNHLICSWTQDHNLNE